jgi:hypothetical protein
MALMNEDSQDAGAIAPGPAPRLPSSHPPDEPDQDTDIALPSLARPSLGDDPTMRLLLPVGRSGWAIAAGYLALVSVLLIPAPFALITGVIAIAEMHRNPSKHGMGRAVFGVMAGGIGSVFLFYMLLSMKKSPATAFLVQELSLRILELVVIVPALMLAIANLHRYPRPAGLTALAAALLLAATIGGPVYQAYLLQRPVAEQVHSQIMLATFFAATARAVAIALLFAAVFSGRKRA